MRSHTTTVVKKRNLSMTGHSMIQRHRSISVTKIYLEYMKASTMILANPQFQRAPRVQLE